MACLVKTLVRDFRSATCSNGSLRGVLHASDAHAAVEGRLCKLLERRACMMPGPCQPAMTVLFSRLLSNKSSSASFEITQADSCYWYAIWSAWGQLSSVNAKL